MYRSTGLSKIIVIQIVMQTVYKTSISMSHHIRFWLSVCLVLHSICTVHSLSIGHPNHLHILIILSPQKVFYTKMSLFVLYI